MGLKKRAICNFLKKWIGSQRQEKKILIVLLFAILVGIVGFNIAVRNISGIAFSANS